MRVILEDNKIRMSVFKTYFLNQFKHFDNVKDCINFIANNEIEELWLDHDLNNEEYVDSNRKDCGFEVVRFLVKNKQKLKVKKIFVHSHNKFANSSMVNHLIKAGYNAKLYPFYIIYEQVAKAQIILQYNFFNTMQN